VWYNRDERREEMELNEQQLIRAARLLWPRILEILDYVKGKSPLDLLNAPLPEIRIVHEEHPIFERFSHEALSAPCGYYHRAGEADGLDEDHAVILLVRVGLDHLAHELVHHAQALLERFPHHPDDISAIEYELEESEMEAWWVVRVLRGLEKA
jgi:hypothetical protein